MAPQTQLIILITKEQHTHAYKKGHKNKESTVQAQSRQSPFQKRFGTSVQYKGSPADDVVARRSNTESLKNRFLVIVTFF